jgi:hypothetical protein
MRPLAACLSVAAATVAASAALAAPGIAVTKTVGTVPGVCATTPEITVLPGTTVYYCYAVRNTGDVTLGVHDIVDSELGTLLSGVAYSLAPGASVDTVLGGFTYSAVIGADTTNTVTWTAYNAGPTDVAQAQASATVRVSESVIELTKTVGTVPGVCAATAHVTVAPGTTVYYCYSARNAGRRDLGLHDLADSELGPLFAGIPYTLAVGASVDTAQAGLTYSAVIDADTTNTATWSAYNAGPTDLTSAQASATVTVSDPEIALGVTVGTVPGACAATDAIAVYPGTTVYYCYTVTNLSAITVTSHDLTDSLLGILLTGVPYALAPGASVSTVDGGFTFSAVATSARVNTATWTVHVAGSPATASATDSATVTMREPIPALGAAGLAALALLIALAGLVAVTRRG